MIAWETVQKLARHLQIDEFTTFREYLQVLFLQRFYGQKGSEQVLFKGGTAIHMLLGSFRFSEDLDFTATLPLRELRPLLVRTIREMNFEVAGVQLQEMETKQKSATFKLRYQPEPFKYPLTVRLEFSLREMPLSREVSLLETPFPVSPYPLVVHLHPEEILAEKVRALLRRGKGREVFDAWFLLSKGYHIRWDWIGEKMAIYRNASPRLERLKERLREKVMGWDAKELRKHLSAFLPARYRPFLLELKERLLEKLQEG